MKTGQMEMVSVEQLVAESHTYRKLKRLLDFERIAKSVKMKTSEVGAIGFGKVRLVMCLILQFMEDLSDREFERFIAENNAAKWFCGFGLLEKTPDFTTICKFRKGCQQKNGQKAKQWSGRGAEGVVEPGDGGKPAKVFLNSKAVVESLNVSKDGLSGLRPGSKALGVDHLLLQDREK